MASPLISMLTTHLQSGSLSKLSLLGLLSISWIPAEAKTLNVRLVDSPVSLDWNGLSTMVEAPLILNLNEGLYEPTGSAGKPKPLIAESVVRSKDLTEYTFTLRRDAKWSDGREIIADDFVNAWIRLLSPHSSSIYIYYLFDIVGAKEYNHNEITDPKEVGIKAIDDHTLRVKLKRPIAHWESNTSFWPLFPVRKDLIEKYGSNWLRPGTLVSSGPFVLDSYEAGKRVVLKRNPFYSKIKSDIDELDFWILPSDEESFARFKSGFFEFLSGTSPEFLQKNANPKWIHEVPILRTHLLGLNQDKYPMNNIEFRKAVLEAITVADLFPEKTSRLAPLASFIPPPLPGSTRGPSQSFNLKSAQAHLKKSGVLLDSKMKIRILTNPSEPFLTLGRNLQSQLGSRLGLTVEIVALPSKDYTAFMNLGDYNGTLLTWTAKVLSSQDFLLPYSREAASNRMNFRNPFYEQWIYEGMKATNPKDSAKNFEHAESLLGSEEAVALPLFLEKTSAVIHPAIKQIYFNHMGIPLLKAATH